MNYIRILALCKGEEIKIREGALIMWFLGCALSCFLLGATFMAWWIVEDCREKGHSNIIKVHCSPKYGEILNEIDFSVTTNK